MTSKFLKNTLRSLLEKINEEIFIATESSYFQNGEDGCFDLIPTANGSIPDFVIRVLWPTPSIRVSAKTSNDQSDHSINDLIYTWQGDVRSILILAHEYGHYLSYKFGNRTSQYEEAINKWNENVLLSKKERTAILKEEAIAWSYGFSTLREFGFKRNKLFRKTKKEALHIYRIKLAAIILSIN